MEVGDVDAKALKVLIPVRGDLPSRADLKSGLLKHVAPAVQEPLLDFLIRLYDVYVEL